VLLAGIARRAKSRGFNRAVAFSLAGILTLNWGAALYYKYAAGEFTPDQVLPMELCDWTAFAVIVALTGGWKGFYEVAYFWGLSGTLQAVLTPNIQVRFPDFRFISFFVVHSGVVAGVLFMTLAMGFRPIWASLFRALGWSQVYLAAALLANRMTGANFGFLSHKPRVASLLDFLSTEKFLYIMELELLMVVFFVGLYAPFAFVDWRRGRTAPVS
jgi:hypothetical integral membrane protein (TIGR02206 family)